VTGQPNEDDAAADLDGVVIRLLDAAINLSATIDILAIVQQANTGTARDDLRVASAALTAARGQLIGLADAVRIGRQRDRLDGVPDRGRKSDQRSRPATT
jgi:hypothetical protein